MLARLDPIPLPWKLTAENFWDLADQTKMAAEFRVNEDLRYLQTASLETLREIFIQYRFFTIFYITDLALLTAKLPFGKLRSYLSEFLFEELGNGDERAAHPQLYDDFLRSLGVEPEALARPIAANTRLLTGIQRQLQSNPWAYGVGLRGMGGECLCQLYLSSMYEHFTKNPAIQAIRGDLQWKFWEIHIGDVDIQHREKTQEAINELIRNQPSAIPELAAGYLESKDAWDAFWQNIFRQARSH